MSSVSRPPVRSNVPKYRPPTIDPKPAAPTPAPQPDPEPKPRKVREIKEAHGTARLTLTINGANYAVRPYPVDPFSEVSALIRLRKADGTLYYVSQHPHGAECECPSFVFDHVDSDGACKHISALRALHLLPPAPDWGSYPDDGSTWEPTDAEVPAEDSSL